MAERRKRTKFGVEASDDWLDAFYAENPVPGEATIVRSFDERGKGRPPVSLREEMRRALAVANTYTRHRRGPPPTTHEKAVEATAIELAISESYVRRQLAALRKEGVRF